MDPQEITYENKRIMEQEALRRTFIQIPMEIFYDSRLTPNDKIIYGRISTFDEFFESRAHTAELLNVSTKQVQRSVAKLLGLGYIEFVHNDGRGNRYRATEAPLRKLRMERSVKVHNVPTDTRTDEIDPSWTNCPNERTNCPIKQTNCPTEYKESIKTEDTQMAQAPEDETDDEQLKEDESPKRYGNADINEILDLWEEATGFSHHSEKRERFAANNLLRKYGLEATKALVRRVEVARRSDDQFAPQIAKPSQLMGKYEKLTALTMWEERTAKREEAERANSNTPDFRKLYANPEAPHYYHDCRPSTPEEKAEVHRKAEEIKKKLDWYVPKGQRKEGC